MQTRVIAALAVTVASTWPIGVYGADAEQFPSKPIRLVVPYPPGGPADTLARLLAPGVSDRLGQTLVVDNRGGAGGAIGVQVVTKASADGYTLLFGLDGPVTINPSVYKNLPYDPRKDLTPVTQLTSGQLLLLAHPSVPYRNVAGLIKTARAQPGGISFASSGTGNAGHLAGVLLQRATGTKLLHVPYKGAAPALTALVGGQVQLLFNNLLSGLPLVKSGKLVALASTGTKRSAASPQVPTVQETVPGFQISVWAGILAPAGLAPERVARLSAAFAASVRADGVSTRLQAQGVDVVGGTPGDLGSMIDREIDKWAKVVQGIDLRQR